MVIDVAPVKTPASTFMVPSKTIAEPEAGVILIAPVEVLNVTAASPSVKLSEANAPAETAVKAEPSPLNAFAVIVPVVDRFSFPKLMAPPESVMLPVERAKVPSILTWSATVKSSVDVNCSAETVAEAVTLPVTVWAPDAKVPLVLKFSFSKSIAPSESVMLPVANVRVPSMLAISATVKSSVDVNCSAETVAEAVTLPVTVWGPDAKVPLVLKFSFTKSIAPPESVIEPSARVRFPIVEPEASVVL